jgi:GAF domain-containing protein
MRSCLQALNEKLSRLGEETASVDGARRRALASEEGARAVAAILRASRSSVMLLDEEAGVLRVAAAVGAPLPPAEMDAVASGESVAGRVFASGETLLVSDVRQDSRVESSAPPDRYASPSFVVAPLGSGLERTGVLCASEPADGRPFDEDSRVLLEILGHQLGRLLAAQAAPGLDLEGDLEGELPEVAVLESTPDAQGPDEEAASRDVELARAVCAAITSEVTPERILADALAAASAALGDAPTSIHLLDGASGELRLEAQRDGGERSDRPQLPADRGLTGTVVATRQPMAVDHPQEEARFDPEVDTPEDAEPGPLVCVPLCFRNKTLGVFRGFPRQTGRATARTAEILAASLSAAARNVLLYRGLVDSIEEVARVRREAAKRPGIGGRPKAGR